MNYLSSRHAVLAVLGSAVVLSLPISAVRADGGNDKAPASGKIPAVSTATNSEVALSGAVIARDKETGLLRPATAKEMKHLRAIGAASKEGTRNPGKLVETRLANGAVVTTLDSSYEVYSIAAKGADGKVHTTCVTGDKVESALATAQAAQPGTSTKKEALDEK